MFVQLPPLTSTSRDTYYVQEAIYMVQEGTPKRQLDLLDPRQSPLTFGPYFCMSFWAIYQLKLSLASYTHEIVHTPIKISSSLRLGPGNSNFNESKHTGALREQHKGHGSQEMKMEIRVRV
ncbi:hypothetical protein VNO78_27792 [Psophocarpus tetragonolobus]|uniref:Uncharacterized protein n=1 Tax=Psophocarpus tetragonolobus TaxID=3891 RepID=A0AAN9S125_PSOTE